MLRFGLTLASAPLDTCYLSLAERAPEAALVLRNAWLAGA
jgi:hypothetical protein